MRKMLVESIKQLKRQKELNDQQTKEQQHQKETSNPKRNAPSYDYHHRQKNNKDKSVFAGYSFCFPLADSEITPKQIELLSQCITIEGGTVIELNHKNKNQEVDFLLINPQLKPQVIHSRVQGKINYKQMLNYNFITDCLKEGCLKNFQKYSLFVNIGEMWAAEKSGSKKVKRDSDNDTVKLSEDESEKKEYLIKREKSEMKDEREEYIGKEQMEEILLKHKDIGDHGFSMNKFIADELTKLMKIYATERDTGRKIAYMKAAAVIRNLDIEIQSERDVENIKGIGKKISDKIKELMATGKINKLEKLQGSEKNIILGEFCKIWGIGPSKAQELYSLGLKTIQELKTRTDLLTKNQKIGLKYFQEFEEKIPRDKVTKMFEYVKEAIKAVVPSLDLYRIEVCGSYRREKPTCGDMDIIISRKDGVYEKSLLVDIVKQLQSIGFLTDHLTAPKPSDGNSSMSYMGVCQFEGPTHHRIDIKYYPIDQFAYAILYFTGSGTFNRMMRLHCMKLGLNLSDHGATPKNEKGVVWSKPIPTCYTEKEIFQFLDLDYKTPKQRDM